MHSVEGGGVGCSASLVMGNCGVGSWGVQGWGAQSRGGGKAGAHRAGVCGVGHMRLGSHGHCVGHGGDLLSVMGLARGRPWGVTVSRSLVTWWLSWSLRCGNMGPMGVHNAGTWWAHQRGTSWRGGGHASQWGRCHLCAKLL